MNGTVRADPTRRADYAEVSVRVMRDDNLTLAITAASPGSPWQATLLREHMRRREMRERMRKGSE
jgi:hypothetical protein